MKNTFERILGNFYEQTGHAAKTPLKKGTNTAGFYATPQLADLSKSLDMENMVDPTAVLDFHMRKASEKEEDGKRKKNRGFEGGLC